jgi:hypothetical protein
MASERQRAANRANAKKSTGPLSQAGKARARQNAFRHGLAARAPLDANAIEDVEKLAFEIVDSTAGFIELSQARSIASAELEVQRVRATITATNSQTFTGGDHEGRGAAFTSEKNAAMPMPPLEERAHQITGAIRRALPTLRILDRYAGRAIARRDNVIRTFFVT